MHVYTVDGYRDLGEVYREFLDGNAPLVRAPDGSFARITRMEPRKPGAVCTVRIGHRAAVDVPERLVLTQQGWRPLNTLRIGELAVARAGGNDLAEPVGGILLDPGLKLRIVEEVSVAAAKGVEAYDLVTEPNLGYDVNGVILKNPEE